MVEGTRPGLTLPDAAQAGDRCNKAVGNSTVINFTAIDTLTLSNVDMNTLIADDFVLA